jgi:hypothetical protein
LGYDDRDDTEYRPAKQKKPLPKTARAQASSLRRLNEARAKYNDFIRQVGTPKQFNQRMKKVELRKLGQMDMDDFIGKFTRSIGSSVRGGGGSNRLGPKDK